MTKKQMTALWLFSGWLFIGMTSGVIVNAALVFLYSPLYSMIPYWPLHLLGGILFGALHMRLNTNLHKVPKVKN